MFSDLTRELRPAIVIFVGMTILTGIVYPLAVTGVAATVFPHAAAGSLIEKNGEVVGSRVVGQPFDDAKYFWPRPSPTSPFAYNAASSCGSNLGPLNKALEIAVRGRVARLKAADPEQTAQPPVDLVTSSASGLDPHISAAAAFYQVGRVAKARGLSEARVRTLVESEIKIRTFGLLGEPRVNVLKLNLALDGLRS